MPSTAEYYNELKTKLGTVATNKKDALQLAYDRATSVEFDSNGVMTRKKNADGTTKGPGTLDVQYAEQQRQMSGGAESSGMLKSGQYGRDLATSQAAYRTAVVQGAEDTVKGKDAIDNETAAQLAEYKAMYGDGTETAKTGTGTPTTGTPNKPADKPADVKPPPTYVPPGTNTTPPQKRTDQSGRQGMGATAPKPKPVDQKKQVTSPVTKKPPALKQPVPKPKVVPRGAIKAGKGV
jgi:hypothetical protein